MLVPKPILAKPDFARDTVLLYFDDQPAREFFMRGSVAWPESTKEIGFAIKEGFALVAGQDVRTKEVWIFEESTFITIDHVFNRGELMRRGLVQFFLRMWERYFCRTFYYAQDALLHRRFHLQCLESQMVQPKPEFIQVPYTGDKLGDNVLREYLARGRLKGNRETKLFEQIETANEYEEQLGPHALRCLLAGFEHIPWVDYSPQRKEIEYRL